MVKSDLDLHFSNCLFKENRHYILPSDTCRAFYSNINVKTIFKGKEITDILASETGFEFTPSVYYRENIFSSYGSIEKPELIKTITLNSPGTLFDELGFQDIQKIEVLKIIGDINGTDVMTINRMTSLKYLDLAEANIVEGGTTYRDNLKTHNNIIGAYFFEDINLEILYLPQSTLLIDDYAFTDNNSLKSISIPHSVICIGESAFRDCSSLESIFIPYSIIAIKDYAFEGCNELRVLEIEDGKEKLSLGKYLRWGLFHDCPLKKIYLGRNLSYYNSPFSNQKGLIDLSIGNNVTEISLSAFAGCSGLTSVTIPNSVTSIGYSAFEYCEKLTSLTLGNSVITIGSNSFRGCTALASLIIPNSVTEIECDAFSGCSGLTSLTIPNSVTSIGGSAFSGCSGLTYLSIPNSVTTIHWSAFENCTGLSSLIIPNSVSSIGASAFAGCSSLTEVRLSANINEISSGLFRNSALTSIEIPEKVSSIGGSAFEGTRLTEIVIPYRVTFIGENAFGNNSNLVKVVSLNTTPPEIYSSTFDSEVEAKATLHVKKGSLVHYWLDPVWKEFTNMADDILCLEAIPEANYGDGEIDLAQYAPEGVALTYETSDNDVVRIDGTKMQIVGAGTATVGALLAEEGTPMEIMGQMRQFTVNQADLTVTVADITIEEGQPLPDFTYLAEGLKYDDTLEDIENLPVAHCDIDENSPVGEYEVSFTDGNDRNYKISTKPAKVTVTNAGGIEDVITDGTNPNIEVYQPNGMLIYKGPKAGAHLQRGVYIIRQGKIISKLLVK